MTNLKNPARESGSFNPFALTAVLIAICTVLSAAAFLAPAGATSHVSTTATYAGPTGYLPAEIVNQAKEIEPMPDTYSNTGLSDHFPQEIVNPAGNVDAMPEMYS